MATDPRARPAVAFDLDMTLVDPRAGVIASWRRVAAETGVAVDAELAASRLGPPIEAEAAAWFPPEQVPAVVERYRAAHADVGVPATVALPGAAQALAAVVAAGCRPVVVSAKKPELAEAVCARLEFPVAAVHGGLWGEGKAAAIAAEGAAVMVGDHPLDVVGARAAGAMAVGVATGPLEPAGADVRLADLTAFPAWFDGWLLERRLAVLDGTLRELAAAGPLVVAFSGGADSAFLLAAAARAVGVDGVLAATGVSASLAAAELAAARSFAAALGVRHELVDTDEGGRTGYVANGPDRCAFCKTALVEALAPLADRGTVLTGTNADDAVAGFRPGIGAAAGLGARTPLLTAGLTKAQVRAASRAWGLDTADKPAQACLASRIAYGVAVTPSRLARVERAELALRQALAAAGTPAANLRVRDLGDTARVEVDVPLVGAVADHLGLVTGFAAVEVDPRGFRSGSLNDALRN
ncbi:MAG: ExsB family protein [Mycobacterium sp.]|nr:ExsB family protein [Mycobacterium sp.]